MNKAEPGQKVRRKLLPQQQVGKAAVVPSRAIPKLTQLLLFVRAGGRCEFDGCNKDLLKHELTMTEGNFAQMAHVVAFRKLGPRGTDGKRPLQINSVRNLMLLCPQCHKLIDDHPGDYSRRVLQEYKKQHEGRIRYLTTLGPDRKTSVVVLKSRIGGQVTQVPFSQIIESIAPRYPTSSVPTEIDLSAFSDAAPGFYEAARHEITERIKRFFEPGGEGSTTQHISVFALAPIPLLIAFGAQLSNKVPCDIYQRHRDAEDWTWKKKGEPVQYLVRQLKTGTTEKVALVISLSGSIPEEALPEEVRKECSIYEITLEGMSPASTFLAMRRDLENFRLAYQEVLGMILKSHGLVETIDVFPAVPAPIAVLCGRELLPKVHPRLRVYDYDKKHNGFKFALEV